MSPLDLIYLALFIVAAFSLVHTIRTLRSLRRKQPTDIDPPAPTPAADLTRSQVDEFSRKVTGPKP